MKVTSTGIVDGIIDSKYGANGTQFNEYGDCTYSLPFKIEDVPANTKSFAFILDDKDAYPVAGFVWVHWLGANLTRQEVMENESISATDFIQGATTYISKQGGSYSREEASYYGGMAPPDKDHEYQLQVFSLDTELDLSSGFYLNELYKAMDGHILKHAKVKGIYQKK